MTHSGAYFGRYPVFFCDPEQGGGARWLRPPLDPPLKSRRRVLCVARREADTLHYTGLKVKPLIIARI